MSCGRCGRTTDRGVCGTLTNFPFNRTPRCLILLLLIRSSISSDFPLSSSRGKYDLTSYEIGRRKNDGNFEQPLVTLAIIQASFCLKLSKNVLICVEWDTHLGHL